MVGNSLELGKGMLHICHTTNNNETLITPQLWFDEATRDKIQILSKDLTPITTLIDPQNIPKEYGGELDWTFEDEPNLDDDTLKVLAKPVTGGEDNKGAMPRGPMVFVDGKVVSAKEYLEKGMNLEAVVSYAGGDTRRSTPILKQELSNASIDVRPVVNGTVEAIA